MQTRSRIHRSSSLHARHRSRGGILFLVSLFVMLGMTMLLVAIINIARQIDDKVRRQNAADAATRSGAGMLARGMNQVAFANHLEGDVFALAALTYGLEGIDDPYARQYAPLRPLFEQILAERAVGEYRFDVLQQTPLLAQQTAGEISRRHGLPNGAGGGGPTGSTSTLNALLWTNQLVVIGNDPSLETGYATRTLPVIDLERDLPPQDAGVPLDPTIAALQQDAVDERNRMARGALSAWLAEIRYYYYRMDPLNPPPMPPQIRDRSEERLRQLLEDEYTTNNIPAMFRPDNGNPLTSGNDPRYFEYVGVVYGQHRAEEGTALFQSPLRRTSNPLAYAQARVFVPKRREQFRNLSYTGTNGTLVEEIGWEVYYTSLGGSRSGPYPNTDDWPQDWNTFTQNWTVQLVPATSQAVPVLLQTPPPGVQGFQMPNLTGTDWQQFNLLNTH